MLARMTVTVKLDDGTTEQFIAMLQQENITLEEFRWSVQDSFGVSFISKLSELFRRIEDKIKERELEKLKKESDTPKQLDKPQTAVETKPEKNEQSGNDTNNVPSVAKPDGDSKPNVEPDQSVRQPSV